MSSHTPSRISLRRKRLNNEAQQAIPSAKRMSPSTDSEEKLSKAAEKMKKLSNNEDETRNSYVSSTFLTPKTCRRKDRNKGTMTPLAVKEEIQPASLPSFSDEQRVEEFSCSQSPQFPSSQIPSTQDCEVVWDCNSPGYTREELKKMKPKSHDKHLRSPVTCAPNRLFTKYKRAAPPPPLLPSRVDEKNSDVAAELDDLLTKVNSELLKEVESESEEDFPDVATLGILKASSQPFSVPSRYEFKSTVAAQISKTVSPESEAPIDTYFPLVGEAPTDADSPASEHRSKSSIEKREVAVDASFSSLEDDDLFSESFLRSTQALEEAILKDDAERTPASKNRLSPLSRIRRKTPVLLNDQKDVFRVNNNNFMKSEVCITSDPSFVLPFKSNRCPPAVSTPERITSTLCQSLSKKVLTNRVTPARMKSFFQPDNARDLSQKGFAKQSKQRTTFQLTASDDGSPLGEGVTQKQKFSRSASDTYQQSSLVREENPTLSQGATQNLSQEFDDDDDDEIFASLMPALIKVEAEELRKPESGNDSASQECGSKKVFSPQRSSDNFLRRQSSSERATKSFEVSKDFSKCDKTTLANKKTQKSKEDPILLSHNGENVSTHHGSHLSSENASCGFFESEIESREGHSKALNAGDDFEDDDDELFLQDGVLDYISLMESQYVSSQSATEPMTNAGNLPPPDKGHRVSTRILTNSPGRPVEEQREHVNRRKEPGYSASPGSGSGAALLQKELLKVGKATDRLNEALKSKATDRLNKALKSKLAEDCPSGSKTNGPNAPAETVSDEEFFQLACEDACSSGNPISPKGRQCVQIGPNLRNRNKAFPRRAFQIE